MQSIVESAPVNRKGNPYRDAEGRFCKESEAVYIVDPETRVLKKYTKKTGPPKLKKIGGKGNPNHDAKGKFAASPGHKATGGIKPVAKKAPKSKIVKSTIDDAKTKVTGKATPGALNQAQWDAITPGTAKGAIAARKALDATPAGRQLRHTTQRWQDDTSEIVQIQGAFMKVAQGKKISANDHADATAFARGIAEAPISPSLYRGARISPAEVAKYKEGGNVILPPSSFTSSQRIASGFAKQPSRRQVVPVLIRVSNGARALPLEVYGDPSYKNEKEWVSAGQFTIKSVAKRSDGVHVIDVEHTAMFKW